MTEEKGEFRDYYTLAEARAAFPDGADHPAERDPGPIFGPKTTAPSAFQGGYEGWPADTGLLDGVETSVTRVGLRWWQFYARFRSWLWRRQWKAAPDAVSGGRYSFLRKDR